MSFHNLMAVFARAVDSDEPEREAAILATAKPQLKFHSKNKSERYAEDNDHFGMSISIQSCLCRVNPDIYFASRS